MTYSGNVIRWSSKGFGFVECDSLDQELFVHHSEFGGGELVEGKSISFDIGDDSRTGKKMAINVTGPAITERRPSPRRRRYPSDDRRRGHSPPRRRYDSRDRYERNRYRSRSPRDRRLQQTRYDSRERDYRYHDCFHINRFKKKKRNKTKTQPGDTSDPFYIPN